MTLLWGQRLLDEERFDMLSTWEAKNKAQRDDHNSWRPELRDEKDVDMVSSWKA